MLIPGETLEAWAIQRRFFALTHRRALVAATTGRLIGISRGLFGGYTPVDVRWQDLKEVKIRVGILSASVTIAVYDSADLALASSTGRIIEFSGLRKNQAQDVYRLCQTHEQAWREKRRVRELEELRAKSGGLQISQGGSLGAAGGPASATGNESAVRLQQAKQMLDAKLITDAEYEAIKARIINSV